MKTLQHPLVRKYGPFVVCFILGLILICYPHTWVLQSAVHALQDALLVAGILGITIEMFAASALVDRAAAEISERLIGYGLPPDAQYVINTIVRTTRVYKDYRKSYRISLQADGSVLVRTVMSYIVVNNGKERDSNYLPKLEEEGMHSPKLISLAYADTVVREGIDSQDPASGVVSFAPKSRGVDIFPSKAMDSVEALGPDQFCSVRWEYTQRMPSTYSDVTSFGGVTVRPTIELLEISDGLEFNAADSPDGENKCEHVEGGFTWKYNRAFVRAQHIRAWWKPKPTNT
jgi:hypothetical protein